jgi:hypothetical protein
MHHCRRGDERAVRQEQADASFVLAGCAEQSSSPAQGLVIMPLHMQISMVVAENVVKSITVAIYHKNGNVRHTW